MLPLFGNKQLNPPPSSVLSLVLTGWSHPPQMQVRSPILCRRARLFRLSGALHKSLPVTFWSHLVTRGQIPRVRLEAQLPGGVTSEGTPFTVLTLPPAADLTSGGREVRQSIGGGTTGV